MSDYIRCPICGSTSLHSEKKGFSLKKSIVGGVIFGGVGLLGGLLGSQKIEITCLNCGYRFKPGDSFENKIEDSFDRIDMNCSDHPVATTTSKPPQKSTKYIKIKIETILRYKEVISDSKVQLLEDLLQEGVVYVEMPSQELTNLQKTNGVKRIISFRELK